VLASTGERRQPSVAQLRASSQAEDFAVDGRGGGTRSRSSTLLLLVDRASRHIIGHANLLD